MGEPNNSHLKFGIMCSGYEFQEWQARCIENLMEHEQIEPALLIIEQNNATAKSSGKFNRIRTYPFKNLLFRFCDRYLFSIAMRKKRSLRHKLQNCPSLPCKTEQKGFLHYFSEEDVSTIKNHQLDFILRFGFGIIRGEILNVPRFGVWSYHHGDEQKFRGGPAGFWEIYADDKVSGVILQRLTDKLDGGVILHKGYFKTIAHSYSGNFNYLLKHTTKWPLHVCKKIINGIEIPKKPSKTKAKIYKIPSNIIIFKFMIKILFNRIIFHLKSFFQAEEWNIGIVLGQPHQLFEDPSMFSPVFLPAPKRGTYLADPFGFYENNKSMIVCEEYDYKKQKGAIVKIEFLENSSERLIEVNHHLSYPFIVKNNKRTYCVPECFESEKIELFELVGSNKFNFKRVLLENVQAVDPTICRYGGRWWLFFSPKEPANTELFIYYSNSLFGDYKPHLLNPVKTDIRSTRPAGNLYVHENRLFRPGQNCSETYGGSIVLNEVAKLTPTEFEERKVAELLPFNDTKYNRGIHTVSKFGNTSLIDSKRNRFLWSHFKNQCIEKMNKIIS